jgi:3-oxoacyl-[acyl-carrier-protein] synthase II
MERRVVITGLGIVTPCGVGKELTWESLVGGRSGLGRITQFDEREVPAGVAGEVKGLKPQRYIQDRKALKLTFRSVHLALVAAKLAVEDASLDTKALDPARFGAVLGSSGGGFDDGPGFDDLAEPLIKSWEEKEGRFTPAKFGAEGIPITYPLFLLKTLPNNAFYYISLLYNIQGENNNIIASYTGGSQAVGDAFRSVRRGDADIMIAGGYDCLVMPNTMFALANLNLLSRSTDPARACRPFDLERQGTVVGEGAGMLILEEISHATNRGARIYGEAVGYGNSSDAHHIYKPCPLGSGLKAAMARALEDGSLPPESVDYINADGVGTVESDRAEVRAIKEFFGDRAHKIPVSSTKSMTGHLGAAAGPVELAVCALALANGKIPPTINYHTPDPECALDCVPNQARDLSVRVALSLNQGLGGENTALVLRKLDANNGG